MTGVQAGQVWWCPICGGEASLWTPVVGAATFTCRDGCGLQEPKPRWEQAVFSSTYLRIRVQPQHRAANIRNSQVSNTILSGIFLRHSPRTWLAPFHITNLAAAGLERR